MSTAPSPVAARTGRPIVAAGAVVLRKSGQGRHEVLLVHRPKYDDWSFPKGKRDRGEHVTACAVREVAEETGVAVRLGRPLTPQEYPVGTGTKVVHYWVARTLDGDDISGYVPNKEIDRVRWVAVEKAAKLLTHQRDRQTLVEALALRKKTRTMIVLRHARARARSGWHADDRLRPLLKLGEAQADRLVAVLAAYDPTRLVSSSSTRCVDTLQPYADSCGRKVVALDALSEEDATKAGVTAVIGDLVAADRRTVVCSHRPVLPRVFAALGVADPVLEPGEMVVVHLRRGVPVATERHLIT